MKWPLVILVLIVAALHQDFWFWHDKSLLWDRIPVGLAYHAGYSVLAAITMGILVRYAWPSDLEGQVSEHPSDTTAPEGAH